MKYLCIILFLAISISSCQQQAVNEKCEKNIIVCFDHYHPKPYKTPGGVGHMPMPKVLYTDSIGTLVEYMPNKDSDTLTIYSTEHFKELGLNYGDFEFNYYPLMKGDTVIISMDSLGYPILSSKHHPGYSRIYNMNYELRKGKTHAGLEAKTCLGDDWVRIAKSIDIIRANNWTSLLMDYCPLDSLQSMFDSYKKNYTDTINSFKEQQLISSEIHDRYQCLLKLKDYESRRMLNEDTAFYRQMEPEIADKYIRYPSYREFLDYYLWFFNQHIPTIRKSQGGSKDWRQTFDELSAKPFQPKSKQALLERCIKEIGENFSAQDVNSYLDKYIHITQDTLLPDRIRELVCRCQPAIAEGHSWKACQPEQIAGKEQGKGHLCGLLGKLVCALPGRDASLGKAERTVQGKRCGIRLSRLQGPGKQLENGGRAGGLIRSTRQFLHHKSKEQQNAGKAKAGINSPIHHFRQTRQYC